MPCDPTEPPRGITGFRRMSSKNNTRDHGRCCPLETGNRAIRTIGSLRRHPVQGNIQRPGGMRESAHADSLDAREGNVSHSVRAKRRRMPPARCAARGHRGGLRRRVAAPAACYPTARCPGPAASTSSKASRRSISTSMIMRLASTPGSDSADMRSNKISSPANRIGR